MRRVFIAIFLMCVQSAWACDVGYWNNNGSCEICPGTSYCPGDDTKHDCPSATEHARTTFPNNYYNPEFMSTDVNVGRLGRTGLESCDAASWFYTDRGRLYEYANYNTNTNLYDITTSHGWSEVVAGYYLTNRSACGSYAYYSDALECPPGSYCPGKRQEICNNDNYTTVWTETFGLETCPAGYYSANSGQSSCEQCTTDSVTGRPAYTDDAGGASSCSVCPAVTGELASNVLGFYYYPSSVHRRGVAGCYITLNYSDNTATYGQSWCYYSETDGTYGGEHSTCQILPPIACAAGYGSVLANQPEWESENGYATFNGGLISTQGKVCGPCSAGTYSGAGATTCSACAVGYTSAAGASSCTANTITINWAGANGVFETGQCTYDGGISTPTTIPTKRGHVFNGWKFVE